ncbi:MAG: nucleotide sugar dehydrogenase [Longimicrobiales bacterium]|nr:nucleotide sugar dehydrogenase [Longimicrobiales bacterium]
MESSRSDRASPVERFREGPVTLGVIGLGYVGLPLVVEAARAGVRVVGIDVSERVVEGVNRGESHIQDVPGEVLRGLVAEGWVEAATDPGRLSEVDAISICVPTPLSKTRDPDVSFIVSASEGVAANLQPGQLVTLESTTYPGTTREILLPLLERTGLRAGIDFHLCFSPERVDPGNPTWSTHNTPKVIGGITPLCTEVGAAFYGRFIETMVPVSSAEAAELTKILENTFRSINIGLANETALIADRLGVDVWEVIDAASTKPFGFMRFLPGPGLGGHCIPVDPHYLSWKMRTLNYRTRFIELASEVNADMPRFILAKAREALNAARRSVNGARVLVLGVAYKPDIDDLRESPALDIIELLEADGAEVVYHDPHVPHIPEREPAGPRNSQPLTETLVREADLVVLVTDHRAFDLELVWRAGARIVDARDAFRRAGLPVAGSWIVKGA